MKGVCKDQMPVREDNKADTLTKITASVREDEWGWHLYLEYSYIW